MVNVELCDKCEAVMVDVNPKTGEIRFNTMHPQFKEASGTQRMNLCITCAQEFQLLFNEFKKK